MSEEPSKETPRTLIQKLIEVIKETGYVQKMGQVDDARIGKYKYALERNLFEEVRLPLANRGVFALPTCKPPVRNSRKTTQGSEVWFCDVVMQWTLYDSESNETLVVEFPGTGDDRQGKGVSIAMTYATKSFVQKTFMIPTGDEEEPSNSHWSAEEEANRVNQNRYESEQLVDDLPDGVRIVGTAAPPVATKDLEDANKWTKMDPAMPSKPPSVWWKPVRIVMYKELITTFPDHYTKESTVNDLSLGHLIYARRFIERVENRQIGYTSVAHDQLALAFSNRLEFEMYYGKITRQKVKNKEGKMVYEYHENVSET